MLLLLLGVKYILGAQVGLHLSEYGCTTQSKAILDSITHHSTQSEHEINESHSDIPIVSSNNTNKSADNTPVNNEVQKVTNNINNSTDNTPVTLSRDQNVTNHLTQNPNVESINVMSVSIDNSVTNSTNNPASVWNHAL